MINQAEMCEKWISRFVTRDQLTELRALGVDGQSVYSGWFLGSQLGDLARCAIEFESKSKGVYFTPNPVGGRFASVQTGVMTRRGITTADEDILERRWILIDVDPIRLDGEGKPLTGEGQKLPVTDLEKGNAYRVTDNVKHNLDHWGFQGGILSDSGNGWHVCYPCLLPNDEQSKAIHKTLLAQLESRIGNDLAHVDQKTFNASRIWKCYGTRPRKGSESSGRLYRMAETIEHLSDENGWNESTARNNNKRLEKLLESWRFQEEVAKSREAALEGNADPIERAKAYLRKADPAIDGQGGSTVCFRVAATLVEGFGLSDGDALTAIQEWNQRCQPPWNERELTKKIADARKKIDPSKIGSLVAQERTSSPAPVSAPAPTKTQSKAKQSEPEDTMNPDLYDYGPDDVATIQDLKDHGAKIRWLWPNWLQIGVVNIIAAQGGAGKTRTCADLLRRIRHGLTWPDGQAIEAQADSLALWVVSDNNHDEMVTLSESFKIEDAIRINATKKDPYGGVTLDTAEELKQLESRIKLVKPVMVIIDTVGNSTDRNLSQQEDAKAYYSPLQVIARRNNTTIICLTHLSANGTVLGRRANEKVRSVIQLSQPDPNNEKRKMWVSKSNSQRPKPLGVIMKDSGADYDDDPPKDIEEQSWSGGGSQKSTAASQTLDWLLGKVESGIVLVSEIIAHADDEGVSRPSLYRAKNKLFADGTLVEGLESNRKTWIFSNGEA